MLAVAASHPVTIAAGPCQARTIAARLPRQAWQRYSASQGAKGHRYYDWAWLAIAPAPSRRWREPPTVTVAGVSAADQSHHGSVTPGTCDWSASSSQYK